MSRRRQYFFQNCSLWITNLPPDCSYHEPDLSLFTEQGLSAE